MKEVVIAYEPVWAIGTGVTALPNKRKKCCEAYYKKYGDIAESTSILYAEVVPANAQELFSQEDVDED